MEPIDPSKFSLDYLLENKVITILSQDYVFEHGTDWDEVDITECIMKRITYLCYRDDWGYPDYSKRFSGVLRHNIRVINFHGIRHTFATRSLESGMDIKTLSRLLGHSSIQISLDLYAHVTDQLQAEHMANLRTFLK